MAQGNNEWGYALLIAVVFGGGYYLYSNYDIKEKPPIAAPRPRGLQQLFSSDKSVWFLNADSVTGPRKARMAWMKIDHSKADLGYREVQRLYRINCDTTAHRIVTMVVYDKDGKILMEFGKNEFEKQEEYSPPSSIMGKMISKVCEPAFDSPMNTA